MTRACDRKKLAKQASIRLACTTFGISETCCRYEHRLSEENEEIAAWLHYLTQKHKRWGSGWNHKRVLPDLQAGGSAFAREAGKAGEAFGSGLSQRGFVGGFYDGSDVGRFGFCAWLTMPRASVFAWKLLFPFRRVVLCRLWNG